jgi:hypothetical protein
MNANKTILIGSVSATIREIRGESDRIALFAPFPAVKMPERAQPLDRLGALSLSNGQDCAPTGYGHGNQPRIGDGFSADTGCPFTGVDAGAGAAVDGFFRPAGR